MLDRLEQAFAAAPGERRAAAPLPRRRLARAAHAAGLDPRLRGAVPHGRHRASRAATETAMRRIEEESARMGVLVEDLLDARAPRRDARARARAGRPRRARARRRRTTPARRRPSATIALDAPSARDRARATRTSCARCSPTCCATRSCTRPPARRSRSSVGAGRRRRRARASATTARACPTRRARAPVRALLARRGRPRARQGRRRPRPRDRARRSSSAHGGTDQRRQRAGGGARFVVRLPAAAVRQHARGQDPRLGAMRALVQRVSRARGERRRARVAAIGPGLLVLLGIAREDDAARGRPARGQGARAARLPRTRRAT